MRQPGAIHQGIYKEMEKRKGMFQSIPWFKPHSSCCTYWAWRRSWTVSWSAQGMRRMIVLTVFCPKQLHVSQYNTLWWHIFKPLKLDLGLDKLPTTQSVWLEHTRRSQVQALSSFVSSAISIGSVFWHLSSSAQLHSSVQTRLSVARAPVWTLAGGFNVIGPTRASNELKNLPHEHVLPWLAMTVACHLALSSMRDMVNEEELRPHNDVWSHTPRVGGSFSTPWSDFSCLKRCHPIVFVWDLWSFFSAVEWVYKLSHPMTTTTDGSASSPSSISAAWTLELASRKPVKHPFFLFLAPSWEPGAGHQCPMSTGGPSPLTLQLLPLVKSWPCRLLPVCHRRTGRGGQGGSCPPQFGQFVDMNSGRESTLFGQNTIHVWITRI